MKHFILEKARSHKYIERKGAPKHYHYVYDPAAEGGHAARQENYARREKSDIEKMSLKQLLNLLHRAWGGMDPREKEIRAEIRKRRAPFWEGKTLKMEPGVTEENRGQLYKVRYKHGEKTRAMTVRAISEDHAKDLVSKHKGVPIMDVEARPEVGVKPRAEGKTFKMRRIELSEEAPNKTGLLYQGKPVYAIRDIDKKNFNPMVHNLLDQGGLKGHVQVYTDVVGGRSWVNVKESELTHEGKTLKLQVPTKEDFKNLPEAYNIMPYDRGLKILNTEQLPRGVGARYLEVMKGKGSDLIAVRWRKMPIYDEGHMLIDFQPEGKTFKMEGAPNVARTIGQQMGGFGRIKAMTGAKNFLDLGNGLSFDFPNRRGPNHVKIILDPDDTYTVGFYKKPGMQAMMSGKLESKKMGTHKGIYFDQLKEIFEKETGLYLSL